MKNKKIIVVGANGRDGSEMISILSGIGIPVMNITAVASARSAGIPIPYGKTSQLKVKNLLGTDFSGYDFALFSAGSEVSQKYAFKAIENGCLVIDNTSFFRMHDDIPLIIPEVNFDDLQKYNSKIIANPNCSTIQTVMALKPLHDFFGLKEVVLSTYQSTSGAGQKGVEELLLQTKQVFANEPLTPHHFKRQIAFNVIPQIDEFTQSLYTKEELKMMNETRKILNLPNLVITVTCVRVPVLVGHAVSVFAKFQDNIDLFKAYDVLNSFDGVKVVHPNNANKYNTPVEIASKNDVFISRLRIHPSYPNALSFWCVADNVRKGAALNAIQIAQKLS